MKTVGDRCGDCNNETHHFDSFSTKTQCHIKDELPYLLPTLQIYDN
jgi:hypothetical protein